MAPAPAALPELDACGAPKLRARPRNQRLQARTRILAPHTAPPAQRRMGGALRQHAPQPAPFATRTPPDAEIFHAEVILRDLLYHAPTGIQLLAAGMLFSGGIEPHLRPAIPYDVVGT